jgi:hypothetical protein
MKNNVSPIFLLLFLLPVPGDPYPASGSRDMAEGRRLEQEKSVAQSLYFSDTHPPDKYRFPLEVASFVRDLGIPEKTILADDEYCILGQLHIWSLRTQNLKILVLGDRFDETTDYSEKSRLFALKKYGVDGPGVFKGLWDVHLGDTDAIVREKLEAHVREKGRLALSKSSETAPLHAFLDGLDMRHQYVIRTDTYFFYFMINSRGTLEIIVISGFDIFRAC